MTLTRQMTFWVLTLLAVVLVLYVLREILLPFVAGMALAYLLDPTSRRVEQLGVGRGIAALIIMALVIVILVAVAMVVLPVIGDQIGAFLDNLPHYIRRLQSLVSDPNRPWLARLFGGNFPDAGKSIDALVTQGSGWITAFLGSLWSGGRALFSVLSLLVITPVVAFYLLCDWARVEATVDGWIPLPHRATARGLAGEIDQPIAGFVRGQALICLILALYYAIGLTLAGLNFGFSIGLLTGLLGFIPFVGVLTGFLIAFVVAIAQFWPDLTSIAMVIGVFVIGLTLDNYVLSPKLVGSRVGLHPVWLIFALIAFGYLFGIVGLLVAVPLAASIGVLVRFALRKYHASPIYTGRGPA